MKKLKFDTIMRRYGIEYKKEEKEPKKKRTIDELIKTCNEIEELEKQIANDKKSMDNVIKQIIALG